MKILGHAAMRFNKIVKRPDIIIATFLMLSGALVAVRAYAILLQSNREKQSIIRNIPGYQAHFKIMSANSCIGSFQHEFITSADEIEIKGTGSLRFKLGNEIVSAEIALNAGFNTLGQLGGSVLRISAHGSEVRLGTRGVDPVRFLFRLKESEANAWQRYEISGPGPILLKKDAKDSYRLEYLHLGQALSEYKSFAQYPMLQAMALHIEQGEPGDCSDPHGKSLDLSPLMLFAPPVRQ